MRSLLLAPLLLVSSGCIAAAGLGAGALVTHELMANTPHVAHVQLDVDTVWPMTIEALHDMGGTEVEVQNYPRQAEARVYGGKVYLQVEAFDLDHTLVRLQFRKHRIIDNLTAEELLQGLLRRYHEN